MMDHIRPGQRRNQHFAAYVCQYVAVTGIDLDLFNKTLEAHEKVHRCFSDLLPGGDLEALQPLSINGLSALPCHTRYFTFRRSCQTAVDRPFSPGVDPIGSLEKLKGTGYIHTEDNVVQYLGLKGSDEGRWCVI